MSNIKKPNSNSPVVLVTGGARRLGEKIAKGLHAKGYRVIIHYRSSSDAANQLCDNLNLLQSNSAAVIQADFNDFKQIAACIQNSTIVWNRLDIIVNNASTFFPTEVGQTSLQEWHDLFNSNLLAPYFLVQTALPYLKATKGHVINIADVHGKKPLKGYGVYSVAKAGLIMLTKVLARELAPSIQVNAIAPGVTLWPENQMFSLDQRHQLIDKTLLKHLTQSNDIVEAIYFLLNQSSMTGEVLSLDCGRLLK